MPISDDTPITDIPMFEDCDEFHGDQSFRISTTKISKRKYHYEASLDQRTDDTSDENEASPDQRSDGAIIMNMDGDALNIDEDEEDDDEFVGVNEYSDENEAYSDDDL